jgi:hypothetical protein
MDEKRKILEFTVSEKDFESFMRANRSLMISEIVATVEDMLYTDKEVGTICRIFVKKRGASLTMECKLHISEVIYGMDELLQWVVEKEEYELAHRIKLINEYVEENGLREKTIRGSGEDTKRFSY